MVGKKGFEPLIFSANAPEAFVYAIPPLAHIMAGLLGLEPRYIGSKPTALPLCYSPMQF